MYVVTTAAEREQTIIDLGKRESFNFNTFNAQSSLEEAKFVNDEFDGDNESDNEPDPEDQHNHDSNQKMWRFGQENILFLRDVHTPPSNWVQCEKEKWSFPDEQPASYWPSSSEARSCHSAPPAALCSPTPRQRLLVQDITNAASSLGFNAEPNVEMSPPAIEEPTKELLTNFIPKSVEVQPTSANNEFDFNSLFTNDSQELQCDQCEKKFRKASDLHLHLQTHRIEQQQNNKNRTYQCPECKVVHRSRAHLEKHLLEQHEKGNASGECATQVLFISNV